jgi:hypothetical protein
LNSHDGSLDALKAAFLKIGAIGVIALFSPSAIKAQRSFGLNSKWTNTPCKARSR